MESRDAYGRQSIRPPPPLLDESEEEGEEGSERSGVDPAEVPFVPVGHATDAMTDDRGQPPTSTSADGDAGAAPASAPAPSPQEQQQVMAGAHSAICERAYAYARFYLAQCADLARSEAMACGTRQGSQAESLAIAVAISRMQAFAEREDHAEESRRFASIYPADAQVYLSASALRSTVAEFVAAEQRMEILARFSERAPMPAAQAAALCGRSVMSERCAMPGCGKPLAIVFDPAKPCSAGRCRIGVGGIASVVTRPCTCGFSRLCFGCFVIDAARAVGRAAACEEPVLCNVVCRACGGTQCLHSAAVVDACAVSSQSEAAATADGSRQRTAAGMPPVVRKAHRKKDASMA